MSMNFSELYIKKKISDGPSGTIGTSGTSIIYRIPIFIVFYPRRPRLYVAYRVIRVIYF